MVTKYISGEDEGKKNPEINLRSIKLVKKVCMTGDEKKKKMKMRMAKFCARCAMKMFASRFRPEHFSKVKVFVQRVKRKKEEESFKRNKVTKTLIFFSSFILVFFSKTSF